MSNTMRYSSVSIDVSVQTVWEYFLDKIMHPDRYLADIEEFKILRQTGQEIVRYMKTTLGEIVEKITIDAKKSEITYKILRHPVLKGQLVNQVKPIPHNKNSALLTVISECQSKDPKIPLADDLLNPKQEALATKLDLES